MPSQNEDIQAIYDSLCDQQDALNDAIQQTTDPQLAATISQESQELAHRILISQNLLFKADSAKLSKLADKVKTAGDDLDLSLKQIQKTADFLDGISTYLGYVDDALDLAKTLASAA
ncbi:MAG TPA: hypothetical protein VF607_07235 [Verrucomicrobiae bacterium]